MAEKIPDRLSWAVEQLNIQGRERLLEIGCGRGVAVTLVCPLLTSGTIAAIDRSAVAIDAARQRNEEHVAAGKAALHHVALEDFAGPARPFDKIFAVNVNLFWLDAARGLEAIRKLLAGRVAFPVLRTALPGSPHKDGNEARRHSDGQPLRSPGND